MFGYIAANLNDLNDDERKRYRAAYCGLCYTLEERCGQTSRFALTYDLAFLSLLLNSLYEPAELVEEKRCILHPAKPHGSVRTRYTDYAADLSIALAYHKCLDDWRDDHNPLARGYAAMLATHYEAVRKRLPRQCAAIEKGLADITHIEAFTSDAPSDDATSPELATSTPDAPSPAPGTPTPAPEPGTPREPAPSATPPSTSASAAPSPDAAANRFGELLGELFVFQDDIWADTLRQFGNQLGRFIYLMDAACDFDRDLRKGSYNPLVALGASQETINETLTLLAARATKAFEKLPLEQDLHLLRSVLYSGMWQNYRARLQRKEKAFEQRTTLSTVKDS